MIQALADDPFLMEWLDSFAEFFEGFGFKANLGRIWTVLFYSAAPLSQKEVAQILGLSSGMVSQGLNELSRFSMVYAERPPERRETLYRTERNLTKIASSILGQREEQIVERTITRVERLRLRLAATPDADEAQHMRLQGLEEVLVLLNLSKAVLALFETFSQYSYHAVKLGSHALTRLRVTELLKWLDAKRSDS